jgi:hypothetical protein
MSLIHTGLAPRFGLPKPFLILVAHLLSNIKKNVKKEKEKGSDIFAPLFVISTEITPPKNKYLIKYNEFCYFRTNDAEITKSGVK